MAAPAALQLLLGTPLWIQFVVFLIFKDLLEYGVHNLLHRVAWMWEFHKLHHSIEELDWIGNMRFHWMEIVIYKSLTYFPLVVLGVDGTVILWVAVVTHPYRPFKPRQSAFRLGALGLYLQLAPVPRLASRCGPATARAAKITASFSACGTGFLEPLTGPAAEAPQHLGFDDLAAFPKGLLPRLVYPFFKKQRPS